MTSINSSATPHLSGALPCRSGFRWGIELLASGLRQFFGQSLVLLPHDFSPVLAFQLAHGEMGVGGILEVIDEERVNQAAADGADDGNRLGGRLLRNGDAEALGDGGDQARERRRAARSGSASENFGGGGHLLGHRRSR